MHSAQHRRCLNCGYILDGLPENRCPECGRPFDPNNPASFLSKLKSGRRHLLLALLGIIMTAIPLMVAELGDRGVVSFDEPWSYTFMILSSGLPLGAVLQCYVLQATTRELRRPVSARQHSECWLAALIISLLSILGFIISLALPRFM